MRTKTEPKTKSEKRPRKQKPKVEDKMKVEVFNRVAKIEDQCRKAKADVEKKRQDLKSSKEIASGLVADLHNAIWEAAHPEAFPLYHASANGTAPQEHLPSDESWKSVKLRDAFVDNDGKPEVSEGLFKKLEDAQLFTLGELTNFTAADGGRKRITDIPGVGPGAAEKIEEACTRFWARQKKKAKDLVDGVAESAKE